MSCEVSQGQSIDPLKHETFSLMVRYASVLASAVGFFFCTRLNGLKANYSIFLESNVAVDQEN